MLAREGTFEAVFAALFAPLNLLDAALSVEPV